MVNARADVQGAGAGMQRVAQAGAELERIADKITRQEDQTAVLQAKNASAVDINKALIDFQGKMTGNLAQDQAAWDAVASKIGQDHIAKLGNPVREQAFAKDFDTLHKASVIQVQTLSAKNQMAQFDTASAGQLANATKGAMAVVQSGPADYVAQVDAQFKAYEDIVNAAPLLSRADKDAKIQAAKQHFYLEVAKYQAEVTPGAFSRDWRDGVWTKHLTPEAVVGLQKFAQTAETTNAVRALQAKYPTNHAAAVREAMSADYGAAHGYTIEQQNKVAGYFEGLSNFAYQQQQRGKAQAAENGLTQIAKLLAANDLDGLGRLANSPSVPPSVALKAAELFRGGTTNWRGDDATYKSTLSGALTGQITASDVLAKAGPGGLSMEQATRIISMINKTPQEDKENFSLALKAFSANNGDKEQQAQFMAALKYQAEKEGAHGEAILYLGDKMGKDTSWNPFANNAPYVKTYEEMQSTGATRLRTQGRPAPGAGPGQPIVIRYDSNGKRIQE
jgi:hypothetical protein